MRLVLIFLSFLIALNAQQMGFGAEFYNLKLEEKREVFFTKMNEMLDISFAKINNERAFVIAFLENGIKTGFRENSNENLARLYELKNKYRVQNLLNLHEYKSKIAPVPKSMAMAQALIESATGTSRFAREANNLFGQWTWSGRGLVPENRAAGKTHKIKIFDSLQESVDAYVLNLNRHFAYEEFRQKRLDFMSEKKHFSGLDAIESLESYSELKERYINLITNIIKKYDLLKYD